MAPQQHELTVFQQGVIATLSALVGSLKNQGVIDGKELEQVHGWLKSAPPSTASGPLDQSQWEWAISPLISKLEINND